MADPSNDAAAPQQDAKTLQVGLRRLLAMMTRAFLASAQRKVLFMLGAATFVVVGATALAQIQLNAWNKPFYDALAQKDYSTFLEQLLVFLAIAGCLLILNVAQTWLNQTIKLRLREGLARDLLNQWLKPGRVFALAGEGEIGVNPDQKIHVDAQHLTQLSTDLGIGLLQASLLLVSFIGVLWLLSDKVTFIYNGAAFSIPGYMVWSALLYAAIGSGLSWLVGRPLIRLDAELYAREVDLRFALVRVNEHADSIVLSGGEADEKRHLGGEVDNVLAVMRRLVAGLSRLTWITAGYGWLAIIAPILAASPGFFGGDLTFGELMVAAGAFTQVQQSLRWYVDNFSTIADWLATFRRVATFRLALVEIEGRSNQAGQIDRLASSDARILFDNLSITSPTGSEALTETHVEIAPGERVLVTGASSVGLTNFFLAVAGLWPWGAGRMSVPMPDDMMFLPRRPYLQHGLLREALSYPAPPDLFGDADLIAACERVGLERLSSQLDRSANWNSEWTGDEPQRLAFARLLLHKPRWVFINRALDSLSGQDRKAILAVFDDELAGAAVLSVGDTDLREGFSSRTLHLTITQDARP